MPTRRTSAGIGAAIAAAIGGLLFVATPIYQDHEGTVLTPYKDVVGVWTVCSGDTRNVTPGQRETKESCEERTQKIIEDFGTRVAEENPDIIDYTYEWSAHTIFAANIGINAYKKSSVNRLYKEGKHRDACRYIRNYKYAGGKPFQGLINRREGTDEKIGEYELCLVNAIPRDLGHYD